MSLRWVECHQKPKDSEGLPWGAQLNIEADKLANDETTATEEDFFWFPASRVVLYINGKPITRNIAKEIRNAWTTQDLRECMTEKFGWTQNTADLID
eukprot:scaffold95788_cov59-Attheya_sp.AAC.3